MDFIKFFKPVVSRRVLLFIAAVVWTTAGSILILRGYGLAVYNLNHLFLTIAIPAYCGFFFYQLMFYRISIKHTRRIINLKNDYPCFFSFFSFKSYLLMFSMITMGIFLRKSEIIPSPYLSLVYSTMGFPLILSAFRLYYYGIFYQKADDLKLMKNRADSKVIEVL